MRWTLRQRNLDKKAEWMVVGYGNAPMGLTPCWCAPVSNVVPCAVLATASVSCGRLLLCHEAERE